MAFPDDKETFPTWVNKNLAVGELGSKIDADRLNEVFRLLENIQDCLGYNFIDGYADLKTKLEEYSALDDVLVLNQLEH